MSRADHLGGRPRASGARSPLPCGAGHLHMSPVPPFGSQNEQVPGPVSLVRTSPASMTQVEHASGLYSGWTGPATSAPRTPRLTLGIHHSFFFGLEVSGAPSPGADALGKLQLHHLVRRLGECVYSGARAPEVDHLPSSLRSWKGCAVDGGLKSFLDEPLPRSGNGSANSTSAISRSRSPSSALSKPGTALPRWETSLRQGSGTRSTVILYFGSHGWALPAQRSSPSMAGFLIFDKSTWQWY